MSRVDKYYIICPHTLKTGKGTEENSHITELGVMKGFKLTKYPSYIEVRKMDPGMNHDFSISMW